MVWTLLPQGSQFEPIMCGVCMFSLYCVNYDPWLCLTHNSYFTWNCKTSIKTLMWNIFKYICMLSSTAVLDRCIFHSSTVLQGQQHKPADICRNPLWLPSWDYRAVWKGHIWFKASVTHTECTTSMCKQGRCHTSAWKSCWGTIN